MAILESSSSKLINLINCEFLADGIFEYMDSALMVPPDFILKIIVFVPPTSEKNLEESLN